MILSTEQTAGKRNKRFHFALAAVYSFWKNRYAFCNERTI